jgi:hypothetical protein
VTPLDPIRKYEEPPPPRSRRRYVPYFIGALGLFVIALVLEDAMAVVHGVRVEDIHEHTSVPIGTHGLAAAAVVIALVSAWRDAWLAARQKRFHWKEALVLIVAGLFVTGLPLVAAALAVALCLVLGEFSWQKSQK